MEAQQISHNKQSHTIKTFNSRQSFTIVDNRPNKLLQMQLAGIIHRGTSQMQRGPEKAKKTLGANFTCRNFFGKDIQVCTSCGIVIPSGKLPPKGTRTTGSAVWKGLLTDAGNGRAATRLHVINSNFGGRGENDGGNLHPGSQRLNHNHLCNGENKFKEMLKNSELDDCDLYYQCSFNWNTIVNDGRISDPQITCRMGPVGGGIEEMSIPCGDGMIVTEPKDDSDDDSSNDD